jgi:hypothetical protein
VFISGLFFICWLALCQRGEDLTGKLNDQTAIQEKVTPPKKDYIKSVREQGTQRETGMNLERVENNHIRSLFQFNQKRGNVAVWINEIRAVRGSLLTAEERKVILNLLSGRVIPDNVNKVTAPWLADELLTVLRMQEPPWEKLPEELEEAAFQPGTDPVVRDYIMQHLGHWWEQNGTQSAIEATLWRGVETSDSTTPATALIALARGYEREAQSDQLKRVQVKAFAMAQDPNRSLAVRATALSLAGGSENPEVKKYAQTLLTQANTAEILRKIAEKVVQ